MKDFEKERVELMEATGLLNINIDRIKEHSNKIMLNCLFRNVEHILVSARMKLGYLLDYINQKAINLHSALTMTQIISDEILSVYNSIFVLLKDYNTNDEFVKLSEMHSAVSEQIVYVNDVINKYILLDEQAKREEYDPNEMEKLLVPRKENKKPKTTRKVKKSSK